MPPTTTFLEKILSYKDRSPLISVFDDAGQSARPLLREFAQRTIRRYNQLCLMLIGSRRRVVYVSFEEVSLPQWVQKNVEIQAVSGVATLDERQAILTHGAAAFLRAMVNILKDVQRALLPTGTSLVIYWVTEADPKTAVVIIDCITPVFLELSMDPIHFLGSLLSLQRM